MLPESDDQERRRLTALHDLQILDTPEEEAFDCLTRLGALFFQVPICLVSLVDECRQWFKSHYGVAVTETTRDISFCSVAIGHSDVFTVLDATRDHRFSGNRLVTGAPGIRFYAGIPLLSKDKYALGTFCIIDTSPRTAFDEQDQLNLRDFGTLTVNLLETRLLQIFHTDQQR
ncbi:MAG: GAF domain-containing protein [Bryobacteraceae bacterium]|nr:GAF domain-containing protein [Bryobacteraceae bacterium]